MADFFSPRIIFPVSALFFLLMGIAGAAIFPQFQVPFAVVLLHFAGVGLFVAGTFFTGRLKRLLSSGRLLLVVFSAFVLYFSYLNFSVPYLAVFAPFVLLYVRKNLRAIAYPLMAAGALSFAFGLYGSGIPLLDPSLRDGGYTLMLVVPISLFLFGFALRLQSAGGREVLLLSLSGAFLLSLSGYRGPVVLLVVSALACAHHRRLVDFKRIVPVFVLLLLFVAVMGWFVAKPSVSPVQLLFHRAAYTNWIEGSILTRPPLSGFGGGRMWLEPHARFAIGEIFAGKHRSITGGFFGSLWFDSGVFGFAAGSFLVGAVMQTVYERRRALPAVYWLAVSYLVLAVEGGLDAVYLAVFLASLFFVSGKNIYGQRGIA